VANFNISDKNPVGALMKVIAWRIKSLSTSTPTAGAGTDAASLARIAELEAELAAVKAAAASKRAPHRS